MKNLAIALVLIVAGCGSRSPYDVSSDQVQKHSVRGGPGKIDLEHLPPGAVKHEKVYHKGDVLPDGTISPGDRKVVTVEMTAKAPAGGTNQMVEQNVTVGKEEPRLDR